MHSVVSLNHAHRTVRTHTKGRCRRFTRAYPYRWHEPE